MGSCFDDNSLEPNLTLMVTVMDDGDAEAKLTSSSFSCAFCLLSFVTHRMFLIQKNGEFVIIIIASGGTE